jgi:GMP synthase-like glutamine amidotransferase
MHFLVLQHIAVEHPGVFRELWREAGVRWTTVCFEDNDSLPTDLDQFDAMVVMGGPMDVWQTERYQWLEPEMSAIYHFAGVLKRPFLGVCLGHQLLAQALGGFVSRADVPEVGACLVTLTEDARNDELFGSLGSPLQTFQWHSAEVKKVPKGATVLAHTSACSVQAFRYGLCAYGVQFHAEITHHTIAEWSHILEYRESLEDTMGQGAVERLSTHTAALLPTLSRTAAALNSNFLRLVSSWRQHAGGAT